MKQTKFLHREIPIRLSHRIEDLHQLPHDLSKSSSMQELYEMYMSSFQKLYGYKEPDNWDWEECLNYMKEVSTLKDEHANIELRVSKSISEYKKIIQYRNGYFDEDIINILGSNPLPFSAIYTISENYRNYAPIKEIISKDNLS